jgi:hypothetical protein
MLNFTALFTVFCVFAAAPAARAHALAETPKSVICHGADGVTLRFKPREFEAGLNATQHFWLIRSDQPGARTPVTRTVDASGTTRFADARGAVITADTRGSTHAQRGSRPTGGHSCKEVIE